ncbi:hypothetical protein Pmar_PMAR017888 [Perkinsus marinus ATCC 50983]|uniref:Uncharacterized protein n=1 Tax=Perkinsus marinus (strain ATCC 50983 / TXsc) TaxID=423536 RepID=C5L3B5_PERM5|nr:hypothetical protein Pmar_PMAR017888 [Perkinsus marinus ATCC 50983]EER08776.1 hypothetical protein Pmar_PMAR017888 [Perkinsus marinus ATCC 50983]|eukprot:XP_002776960.1 hypothetical protein Pmar_PMAR017888 [Perkinsus marinus ATCC 50983]
MGPSWTQFGAQLTICNMEVLHLITSLMIISGTAEQRIEGVYEPCVDKGGRYAEYIIRIEFKMDGSVILTHQKQALDPKRVYKCLYSLEDKDKDAYIRASFKGSECDKLLTKSRGRLNKDSLHPSLLKPKFEYLYMKLPTADDSALYKEKRHWACPT